MRILGARIFFKFFGGKINHIWTDVTYRGFLKIWRMRIFERENLTILNRVSREWKFLKSGVAYFLAGKLTLYKKLETSP